MKKLLEIYHDAPQEEWDKFYEAVEKRVLEDPQPTKPMLPPGYEHFYFGVPVETEED